MNVTDQLVEEHKHIEKLLGLLQKACSRVKEEEFDDDTFFERALNFLRDYADAWHHGKEERALLPALEQAGAPLEGEGFKQLLTEHEYGYRLLGIMDGNFKEGDLYKFAEMASEYIDLLKNHIAKENEVLYPLAERVLNESSKAKVISEFKSVEGIMNEEEYDFMVEELNRLEDLLL